MSSRSTISPFTVIVTFLVMAIVGIALSPLLPIKLAPSRTLPAIMVSFTMPNNSARVVEMESTSKLEGMLARIKGVKNIHSTSGNGWGEIVLELDKHTAIDAARFEASTIVRQTWADLPREVSYPIVSVRRPDDNASKPFMTFTLNSTSAPYHIQQYAENNIKPLLSDIEGLYNVEVLGSTPLEWDLEYDHDQLQQLGITIQDLQKAISYHYGTDFLGMAPTNENGSTTQWMRLMLVSNNPNKGFDASSITIQDKEGNLVHLDQLVKVTHKVQEPTYYYRINGLNSIYLFLTAEESANQLQISKKVHKAMEEVRHSLPEGYEIYSSYDATEYIHKELNKIYIRSGLTILILLLLVLLFTRNVHYLLLITVSLAVTLFIAVILYYLSGLEIQLYSLAGITISLSLIIDNVIIMTDHLMHKKNRKAFLPILAATLTTIGALSIIFLLDENVRLNLQDFAAVVMINLLISLLVALFFVPAMVERLQLKKKKRHKLITGYSTRRFPIYVSRIYGRVIVLMSKKKWIPFTAIVLIFGLPIFLLPEKWEQPSEFAKYYNKVFDNNTYKDKVKPILEKALGGTLRLFVKDVYQGSYFTRNDEMMITITASMPNGTTLSQMNDLIKKMERYLSSFPEIKQFQTRIQNARQASIHVFFHKEYEKGSFPYQLKSHIINKALELGGGSWGVYGLQDIGFSNDVKGYAGEYKVKLFGYNYDDLKAWADSLQTQLLSHRRIKEVTIDSDFSWYKNDYKEYAFTLHEERLATLGISPSIFFSSLAPIYAREIWAGNIVEDGSIEVIKLNSLQAHQYDLWALKNRTLSTKESTYKLGEIANIDIINTPQEIGKENQQYRLVVQYDYLGEQKQGNKILDREIATLRSKLPMGYTAEKESLEWEWKKDHRQYLLIGLLIVIIFFTTSILFNSIKQPLTVIFIIPVSFIGVFLTFYLFQLNFDQGGYASFILLSGITVNASIYILNEYNIIRKQKPLLSPLKAYLKAWNTKIIPIFLTIISTILGFIPFMIGVDKEAFWFPLAAGTIGGLVMSIIGIFLFLPLLFIKQSYISPYNPKQSSKDYRPAEESDRK